MSGASQSLTIARVGDDLRMRVDDRVAVEEPLEIRLGFENAGERVTESISISGDRDTVLHVVVQDMDRYNEFLNGQILKHPAVRSASSTFVLRRVKYSTRLPLPE